MKRSPLAFLSPLVLLSSLSYAADSKVVVGYNGELQFYPDNFNPAVGDTVTFEFQPKNHSGESHPIVCANILIAYDAFNAFQCSRFVIR
jgi:hypothetical protein